MTVIYIPPSKNVGESVHDINANFENLNKNKLDKIEGLGLSEESFTAAEKQKLAGLKNYDDTAVKSDISKLKTEKADSSDVYTISQTDEAIAAKIAEIIAGAPTSFDTLKEIADWINEHADSAAAMNSKIQKNAGDITALTTMQKAILAELPIFDERLDGHDAALSDHDTRIKANDADITNISAELGSLKSTVNNKANQSYVAAINSELALAVKRIDGHDDEINNKLDKAGGILDEDATITIQGSSDNRYAVYKQGSVEWYVPSDNTGWANQIRARTQDGEVLNAFGAYGRTNGFEYWFFGKAFNDKVVTIYPTGEIAADKFTGDLNGHAATSTYADKAGKLSNTQKVIKTISTSHSSPLSIIEASLFTNYNLILCNAVTSSNRYSVILPMKRIKSLGTSGRYEPFIDLMFTYVNDNTMTIRTGLGQSNPTITKLELIEIG